MKIRIIALWIILSAGIAQADFGFSVNGNDTVTDIALNSNETLNIAVHLLDGSSTGGFDLSVEIDNGNGGALDSTQATFPTSFDLATHVDSGSITPESFLLTGGNLFTPAVNGPAVIADNICFTAGTPGETVVLRLISQDGSPSGTLLDTVNITVNGTAAILTIQKATVKAGKDRTDPSDGIILSGTLAGGPENFDGIDSLNIQVASGTEVFSDLNRTIPISTDPDVKLSGAKGANTKLKYFHSNHATILVSLDLANGKFYIVGRNLNLTGLKDSLAIDVSLDSINASTVVGEDIINGDKKIAGLCLLSGHTDTLSIQSAKVGNNADTLALQGGIAADAENQNADLAALPVTIRWGAVEFLIPAGNFIDKKGTGQFTCSKVELPSNGAVVSATIDLQKCTFKVKIKNSPALANTGTLSAGLEFADFNQAIDVILP